MWIERRFPCSRTRRRPEWIAEPAARGQRSPDAAHLPAEAEVVVGGAELISVAEMIQPTRRNNAIAAIQNVEVRSCAQLIVPVAFAVAACGADSMSSYL